MLFDADETLFHFDAFYGLQRIFSCYGVEFTEQDYHNYQEVNKLLWITYQNHEITAQQLQIQRFEIWTQKLKLPPQWLNSAFLSAMSEICVPLDGAIKLLSSLKDNDKLGIVTNGFTELQQVRLERTGLKDYFDMLVISKQVGIAKPHRAIFDHAIRLMKNPTREQVLMVGDNIESDILGGLNAGLDTCWLNRNCRPLVKGIKPHFQVTSLNELESLLIENF